MEMLTTFAKGGQSGKCTYVHTYIYIYIYIYRERERDAAKSITWLLSR